MTSLRHLAAAGVFAGLALVWTFPLGRHLSTHLPGAGMGDNVVFVWNFWWMRTALATGVDYFHTTHLFVPTGADLTLHTHTALPALVGATALKELPIVAAQNATILVSLFLNGFCAYLLAWRVTRDHGAAVVGGLVFGGSPYIAAHLNGHFNLTAAWTVPLFAIAASEAVRGSTKWGALAGLLLAATAYIDYYYVLYEGVLLLCLVVWAARTWSITWRGHTPRSRRLAHIIGVLAAVDLVLIATIAITGGFDAPFGSVRGVFNPLQILWILIALFLWLRLRPRIHAGACETWMPGRVARASFALTAVFLAGATPLIWKAGALLLRGDYVTQTYHWRSAPKGIDVATLLLGNPYHPLWGNVIRRLYGVFGIDAIESTAWLGLAPIVLAAWLVRRHWDSGSRAVRQWLVIGALFFVWALGPHLMAFGRNSGMILPQALLQYVPVVNNARMPGRAIVVTYLALAVLAALAAADWRATLRTGRLIVIAMALAVVADFLPAPFPLVAMDHPSLYDTLRDRVEQGAVCELPLGIRDGFGARGTFDERVLFYQTVHQRPLVGGFVARLPRRVTASYESDPLLAGLLRLSGHEGADGAPPLPDRQLASARLQANGIRFIVLDRSTASAALVEYVERVLPVSAIVEESPRALFLVGR